MAAALFVSLFLNALVNYCVISQTGPKTERVTILGAATPETGLGKHDFCSATLKRKGTLFLNDEFLETVRQWHEETLGMQVCTY